jgi:hypothetical protein
MKRKEKKIKRKIDMLWRIISGNGEFGAKNFVGYQAIWGRCLNQGQ